MLEVGELSVTYGAGPGAVHAAPGEPFVDLRRPLHQLLNPRFPQIAHAQGQDLPNGLRAGGFRDGDQGYLLRIPLRPRACPGDLAPNLVQTLRQYRFFRHSGSFPVSQISISDRGRHPTTAARPEPEPERF